MNVQKYAVDKTNGTSLGLASAVFVAGFIGTIILPFYLYLFGAGIFWQFFGVVVFLIIVWYYESYKLMRYEIRNNEIVSIPGYFSVRFRDRRDYIRVFAAVEIITISMVISALILKEFSLVFSQITGISASKSALIFILVISIYQGAGGIRTITRTAVFKSIFVVVTFVLLSAYMYSTMGVSQMVINMMGTDIRGSVSDYLNILFHNGRLLTPEDYISLISIGFLATGMPFFLNLFFSFKDARKVRRGRRVTIIFVSIFFLVAACLGGISRGYLYPEPITNSISEYFFLLIQKLEAEGTFGMVLSRLLMADIILAFATALEGSLNATVISVYEDILVRGRLIRVNKFYSSHIIFITSIVTGVIIYFTNGLIEQMSIDAIIVFIAALGCSVSPTVIMSFAWKRMNKYACLAGLFTGLFSVPLFKYGLFFEGEEHRISLCEVLGINSVLPSVAITFCVIVLVGLITPKPEEEVVRELVDVRNRITEKR